MADALVPFVFDGAAVRGAFVRLDGAVRDALAAHRYPPPLARVLAELAAATALIAASLKGRGSLVAQLSAPGPVRLAVVECDHALSLRATAQWDEDGCAGLDAGAPLAALAGDPARARFAITIDSGDGAMAQGIVAVEPGSVAGMLAHYLARSAQVDSRLALARVDGRVAGLLVQKLPDARADDPGAWPAIAARADAVDLADLVAGDDPIGTLGRLWPDRDVRVFATRRPRFGCRCSPARASRSLAIAGRDEIEAAIAATGGVEVTCEFCGRRYTYTAAQARALTSPGGADPPRA
ncbi:MAG: Hsp33 family molecular chaperone HslO [Burkholderiales bacterium]